MQTNVVFCIIILSIIMLEGEIMLRMRKIKKLSKKALSLVLIFAVMFSLAVPFPVTVFAVKTGEASVGADEAATDESIYALLYIKDTSKKTTSADNNYKGYNTYNNMELVFQNSDTRDPNKPADSLIETYSGFAGTCYHTKELYITSEVKEIKSTISKDNELPWYKSNKYTSGITEPTRRNIVRVDFKDKIAPTYIASWFYGFARIRDFDHLRNLDTSRCKDMSFAFYCSTSTSWQWDTPEVEELDFSTFETGNVEDMDYFVRLNSLKTLNLSNFDFKKVGYLSNFITYCYWLTDINLTGIDISKSRSIYGFITNCNAIESIDMSYFNPWGAHEVRNLFLNDSALKNVTFAENFSPGKDFPSLGEEVASTYTGDKYKKNNKYYKIESGYPRVRLSAMFQGCTSLEEVDFGNWDLYTDSTSSALTTRYYEYPSFFKGCKNLRIIKNIDKLFIEENNVGNWSFRYMFDGCESLTSINLHKLKSYIGGPGIFKDCKNLRNLDLSGLGLNWWKNTWYQYTYLRFFERDSDLDADVNIYEGCEEISEVSLSPYYPPAGQTYKSGNDYYKIGYNVSYPSGNRTWRKIADLEYDSGTYTHYVDGNGNNQLYRYPTPDPGSDDYKVKWEYFAKDSKYDLVEVGETLSAAELFKNFKPQYAGTWVAESDITFNSNGGTPKQQSVKGARKSVIDTTGKLTEPTKNGYTFGGWYYEDDEGEQHEFVDKAVAESWTYYAKWIPNKYNIVLHSNETTDQTITISNVLYDDFVALHGNTFTSEDSEKILAGWNTQASGNGTDFAANESVDKLTTINGATVDLYAMWRIPDATVTFDSQGGSSVEPKHYTLSDTENVPYGHLSEPVKDGYTFAGWYTKPGGPDVEGNRKVVSIENDSSSETAYVSESCKLYAFWQRMPLATFKLNGGEIKGSTDDYVKVVDYGEAIGTVPTPSNGSLTFEGWYRQDIVDGDLKETYVSDPSGVNVTENVTFKAHWGWQPKFETNGGKIVNYPTYPTQAESDYKIGSLPEVERDNYTFAGWYSVKTNEPISTADNVLLPTYAKSIDLSAKGAVFRAHWTRNAIAEVKLNPDGGSYTDKTGATVNTSKLYTEVYVGEKIGELPTPVKAGADFAGWYNASDTKYTYNSIITENITLTAQWTAHNCTVTFDPGEGEMAGSTTYTIASGKSFKYLPGANYMETNGAVTTIVKSFGGWYTKPNGGGEQLTTETQITGNVTYYANWVDNKEVGSKYTTTIRWNTPSSSDVTNVGDRLVFHPQGSGNQSAKLEIDFKLTSGEPLETGTVRITLPKVMFKKWDNTDIDNELSFSKFSVETSTDGQYYILTNNSAFNSTTLVPDYIVDPMQVKGGYTDANGVYQDYYSKDFNVKIEVKENNNFVVKQQRNLSVEMHTEVHTQIIKDQSTATLSWNTDWGDKPEDADEYFYVVWNLKSYNNNSNQPYKLKWVEDTVHDGSVVYAPSLNTWSDEYTTDSSDIITVVTRHPRAEAMAEGAWAEVNNEAILNVKWKSNYEEQFRTTGKASAFVGEEYDDGARSLTKSIPGYGTQDNHYISGGQDLILNTEASKLNELKFNLDYNEQKNTDSPGWSAAGEMVINPRTYLFTDGVKGRNDVLISGVKDTDTVNKNTWNAAGQTQLDDGDYYFTKLHIVVNEYDSVMLDDDGTKQYWSNPYQNNNIYDYGNINIYIRKPGSSDFTKHKTVLRSELTEIENEGGYETTVALPSDTVGYKIEYTSQRYLTKFKIDTGMKLNDTRKLHSLTSTYANAGKHTLIKNKAQVDIVRDGETNLVCESKQFNPWLSSYELTLSKSELMAEKSCLNQFKYGLNSADEKKYFVKDDTASTIEFPVAITGWAYSKNQQGYYKRVKSGIFYDLLPYGFTVDRSKIIVCGRTDEQAQKRGSTVKNSQKSSANATSYSANATEFPGKITEDYYSVRFTDNWENSGQTMMIIDIDCPEDMIATGFVVYYKCKTTINNLHFNGTTPKNYIAFTDTTPEQSLPESRMKPREQLDDNNVKMLYASVDSKQTAYNYNTTTLRPPIEYQYGADSGVLTEGEAKASHQVVGLNTDYSYNISYEGDTSTKTKNLVFYDVIERHIDGAQSEWQGKFKSVDVSKIKQHTNVSGTCDPVVYYISSDTIEKKNITREMFDLDYKINDTKIWTSTKPDNSKVVAIAVDCRNTTSGGVFELGKQEGMDFTIHMTSPDEGLKSDIETYNQAVIKGYCQDIAKDIALPTDTSVTLRFMNPILTKTAFPESGTLEKPESVVMGSVMYYYLTIYNPDPELPINTIVVEDEFPNGLVPYNDYKFRFNGGDWHSFSGNTSRVTYNITEGENSRVFAATVDMLKSEETVELQIPVKVNLPKNTVVSNEARITSVNGVPYSNLKSDKTYHVVTGVKAKILKVNSKGDPLEGATLQIYEKNDTNCDAQGKLREGAIPMNLENDGTSYGTSFTSTEEVSHFDVHDGEYILHETAVPQNSGYKLAEDIPFRINVEGIIYVNGESVSHVTMVDEPPYKIIFHENKPGGTDEEKQQVFKIVEPKDLDDYKITHFYDIPEWAGDEYVFAGWYHNSTWTATDKPNTDASTASNFEADSYPNRGDDNDYHLYAKWIEVGTVNKATGENGDTNNYGNSPIRGFGLAGVQIRGPEMFDSNYNTDYNDPNDVTVGGMRFVTSLSERLLSDIDALSAQKVDTGEGTVGVEYGYAVATEENITAFTNHYNVEDTSKYKLQYKGRNVNGVDTTGQNSEGARKDQNGKLLDELNGKLNADNDYYYVTNVNCTRGTTNSGGTIKDDHRNFSEYRLYTLIVTYEGNDADKKNEKIDARSYIRYYDANGKLRVFYNNYSGNRFHGGCMCSYNQVSAMALPQAEPNENN